MVTEFRDIEALFKRLGDTPGPDEEFLIVGGQPNALLMKAQEYLGEDDCTYLGTRMVTRPRGSYKVVFKLFNHHKGMTVGKWAYAVACGIDPTDAEAMAETFDGFDARHVCNRKNCVNPGHIYLAPQSEARMRHLELLGMRDG